MKTMTEIQGRLNQHFVRIEHASHAAQRRLDDGDTELRTAQEAFATFARAEVLPRLEQVRDFLLLRGMAATVVDNLQPGIAQPCQAALCFAKEFMPAEKVRLYPQFKITVKLPDLAGVQFEVTGARGKPQARREGTFPLNRLPKGEDVEELILRAVTTCLPVPTVATVTR
jgi:hypothetical protein